MSTYTSQIDHPLNDLAEHDKKKLNDVIEQYNKLYAKYTGHDSTDEETKNLTQALNEISEIVDGAFVHELTSIEGNVLVVARLLVTIDDVCLRLNEGIPTSSNIDSKYQRNLGYIMDDFKNTIARVVHNTSIQKIHAQSHKNQQSLEPTTTKKRWWRPLGTELAPATPGDFDHLKLLLADLDNLGLRRDSIK